MASFAIITDSGVVLDVAPDSKLTVEFLATTFNEETVLSGSFSYPVLFPFTPKNDQAFTNGRYLENRLGRKSFEVNVSLLDMSWKRGILKYDVSSKGYEGVVTVDNSVVADLMREVTIAEIFTITDKGKFVSHKSFRIGAEGDFVNDKIALYNNSVGVYPFAMPTYINPLITGELNVLEDGKTADLAGSVINDFSFSYRINAAGMYSAFFYLTWVIQEVCNYLGFTATGSYLKDDFIRSLIIDNTGAQSGDDISTNGLLNPAQHLPGISISDFFKSLRNDHKVLIYFDSQTRTVHFEKSAKILSQPNRLDISGAQIENSLSIKGQSVGAYKLKAKIDDSDDMYKTLPYEGSVIVGYTDTPKEVQMTIGKPFMANFDLWEQNDVRLPYKQQVGNLYGNFYNKEEYANAYNADNTYNKNPFAFRLLSYKGNVSLADTVWIAQATTDDKGSKGVIYENSLALGGAKGMINRFSLPWYSFFCISEQVELKAKFNVTNFMGINPLQKLFITGENRTKIEALMDRITFEPNNRGTSIDAKIVCYPHYDLNAVASGFRVIVNEPENVLPTGILYVKLYMNHIQGDGFQDWCDINLDFYQDQACTVPAIAVNNIPVNLKQVVWKFFSPGEVIEENDFGQVVANNWRYNAKQNVYWNVLPYKGQFAGFSYYAEDPSPSSSQKFEIVAQYRVLNGVSTPYD
ncbi:hypothetical protein [Sphingobacterium kitahiroshimense]|uniref:hypothetical protein n=1 Tax=Sphingobacterium kitahiroshimense TaxID=470446 RepID=UPI0032094A0C